MIDINELRRLAQHHDDMITMAPIKPATLFKLLDRLEAAEKERDALLNALETLTEHFEYYMGDNECRQLENARAAIAKATEAKP